VVSCCKLNIVKQALLNYPLKCQGIDYFIFTVDVLILKMCRGTFDVRTNILAIFDYTIII